VECPRSKASPTWRALNFLPFVSSDRCSQLVIPLHSQIVLEQSQDCANVLYNLRIGCVASRLARSFQILRMRIAISRLRKFLACAEHIHIFVIWCLIELLCYHHIRSNMVDCLHLQHKYPSPSYMLAIYSYATLKQENVKSE